MRQPFGLFSTTFQDLGLIPWLSRSGKFAFWIMWLSRICMHPVIYNQQTEVTSAYATVIYSRLISMQNTRPRSWNAKVKVMIPGRMLWMVWLHHRFVIQAYHIIIIVIISSSSSSRITQTITVDDICSPTRHDLLHLTASPVTQTQMHLNLPSSRD